MKVLIVNKFLYHNGGSETYIFKIGEYLSTHGHEVQYFGMESKERIVGNAVGAYTNAMDFHGKRILSTITYPIKTIYSKEARKKIRKVLEDFKPDAVHLNNFNYQITPSIILEIVSWRKKNNRKCKIIYTAHDGQLVCPNHMLYNPNKRSICQECVNGKFINCTKNRCIHGSLAKSLIGSAEAIFWNWNKTYSYIDIIICPSFFMKRMLDSNPLLASKTIVMHNFIDKNEHMQKRAKKNYVIYFGGFSEEKGVKTLIQACKELPHIKFVFVGSGTLSTEIDRVGNADNIGFKTGGELKRVISEALFSVCPSELNENCPFSVLESQMLGTPVIGSRVGGIPELIKENITGELFERGNVTDLISKISKLWDDRETLLYYTDNCSNLSFDSIESYCDKLIKVMM